MRRTAILLVSLPTIAVGAMTAAMLSAAPATALCVDDVKDDPTSIQWLRERAAEPCITEPTGDDIAPPPWVNPDGTVNMLLVPDYMPVADENGPMLDETGVPLCARSTVKFGLPPAISVNGPDPVVGEDYEERPSVPPPPVLVPCPS